MTRKERTGAIALLKKAKALIGAPDKVVTTPLHAAETADGSYAPIHSDGACRWCLTAALGRVAGAVCPSSSQEPAFAALGGAIERAGFRVSRDPTPANHAWMMRIYDDAIRSLEEE